MGRRGRIRVASAGMLLIVATAAAPAGAAAAGIGQKVPSPSTQADPGTAADPIVVEGRVPPDEVTIRALARAISPRVGFDQPLARFTDPVCFATGGLPSPMLRMIGARLAETADAAGISLAGDGCTPNILVMFVDDSRAEAARLMKRRPGMFVNYQPSEMRAILNEPGPVHVWSVSEVRSRDGDRLSPSLDGPPTLRVPVATRIGLVIRCDMLSTVMLVDRKAVIGRSLQQMADYAAMRTLAMVRPKGATGGDTILTLFDSAVTPPDGMTAFDRGYLKALYDGSGTQSGATKVAMIARSIARNAAAADVKDRGDGGRRPPE